MLKTEQGNDSEPMPQKQASAGNGDSAQNSHPKLSSIPQAPALNLPKGGGAIHGIGEKFEVNMVSGSASASIPVPVSPARSGTQPSLTLSYNSGSGNGPFGLGWQLGGVPSITRKTDKGLPKYYDNGADVDSDVFLLAGAEDLVPVFKRDSQSAIARNADGTPIIEESVQNGYIVRQYMPRIEGSFIWIERWTKTTDPTEIFWRTISPSNTTTIFGSSSSTRVFDPLSTSGKTERIMSWLVSESYDTKGNATIFNYVAEDSANVDTTLANEKNRTNTGRSANRYIKSIQYGNRVPNRNLTDWTVISAASLPNETWNFTVVFDYGEHDVANPKPDESAPWPCRKDPFSSYRSGFEIRTYRLCRRILMFHNFKELDPSGDVLVSSTNLTYDENPVVTYLTSAAHMGYVLDAAKKPTIQKSLPPVDYSYTSFPSDARLAQLVAKNIHPDSLENLPYGVDGSAYQFLNLDGEGMPGILTEQADAWFYKENLSANNDTHDDSDASNPSPVTPRLGPLEILSTRPSISSHEMSHFGDVSGSGTLDLVSVESGCWGYYERTGSGTWTSFKQFPSFPNLRSDDPGFKLVDLTGDGLIDILICGDRVFHWYPSLGVSGYGPGQAVTQALDENNGPSCVFSDTESTIYLADMSGDGLSDLVRIQQTGGVCYWPNIGYGQFGSMIEMDNPPFFDRLDIFSENRVRLADVDGSGTTDLIYLGADGAVLFANQSGNSFSAAKQLGSFLPIDEFSVVSTVDLLGNGTTCLVWSTSLPGNASTPMRFLDIMEGQKPHLLTGISNNLGGETQITYAPSTKFFLDDKQNGTPWITRLPFPVQCVAKTTIFDHVSGNKFTQRYHYSHGYFDGIEREFRGFARVDSWDTEDFKVTEASSGTNLDPTWHIPPVKIRTWYHTGVYLSDRPLEEALADEYYRISTGKDDFHALGSNTIIAPESLGGNEFREAYRAMKGHVIRKEVYADDNSALANIPYSIDAHTISIRTIQNSEDSHFHSIFMAYPRESVTYELDRNPEDARTSHDLTLEVDQWGNTVKSLSIAYGRQAGKSSLQGDDKAKQETTIFSYFDTDYTNDILTTDDYRLRLPFETRQYELTGFALANGQKLYNFDDFARNNFSSVVALTEVPYEQIVTPNTKRLIEHSRVQFRSDKLDGLLAPGVLQPLAIPGQMHQLCLTPGMLSAFQRPITGQPVEKLLPDVKNTLAGIRDGQCGYVDLDNNGSWWKPLGKAFFHPDPNATPAAELAEARSHFFMSRRFKNAFAVSSFVNYDDYSMFVTATEDALGNTTSATMDYRVLSPQTLTDQNGNQTSVAYDALGLVAGTALMGKPGQKLGDNLDGFNANVSQSDCDAFFSDPRGPVALSLLGNATSRILYDVDRFQRDPSQKKPAYAATIARDTHVSDLQAGQVPLIRVSFNYSDGLERTIQLKGGAEPGPLVDGGPISNNRWVTSGWSILNNKGAVVRSFEPFFDDSNGFKPDILVGVSSTMLYDPVGRDVVTLSPNHCLKKVVFNPWSTTTYDFNDNILISDPKQDPDIKQYFEKLPQEDYLPSWYDNRIHGQLGADEQNAASKATVHANTPSVAHFDVIGRTILAVSDNGADGLFTARSVYDIQSNILKTYDAKDRLVSQMDWDMLGRCIHVASMDAAERWTLTDVGGLIIHAWTSRGGHHSTIYDELRRPLNSYWGETLGQDILVQKSIYGESMSDGAAHNLRGKVAQSMDQAGTLIATDYDWKGNLLHSTREFADEYKQTLDWSSNVTLLANSTYSNSMTYDAYNRPLRITSPDGSIIAHKFDERGNIIKVLVNMKGELGNDETSWPVFITNIEYDAKGQIQSVDYGNGTKSTRAYDPDTLRLRQLRTIRPSASSGSDVLQDLNYTYDPVGNVSHIQDKAIQTIYFRNSIIDPSSDYTYDPLYRLIRAAGREHLGLGGNSVAPSAFGSDTTGLAHPANGNAMATYVELYQYDSAGNMLQIKHSGSDATKPGWTKTFNYAEISQIPGQSGINNRLSSTTVGNATETYRYDGPSGVMGNVTSMPQTTQITWDFLDQLKSSSRQILKNGGTAETTYYVYDSSGTRVRKVTERQAAAGQTPTMLSERYYLGPSELYREYAGDGTTITLERETLSVPGVSNRAALVETRTQGTDSSPPRLIRYQFANFLGSAVLELDDQAQIISYEEYFPYGSTSCQTLRSTDEVPKRYRYSGKERDEESGLYYHGARYYAPWIMRWISPDPIGTRDSMNLYQYVGNNPVIHVDMTGFGTEKKRHKSTNNIPKDQQARQMQQSNKEGKAIEGPLADYLDHKEGRKSYRQEKATGRGAYDRVHESGTDEFKRIKLDSEKGEVTKAIEKGKDKISLTRRRSWMKGNENQIKVHESKLNAGGDFERIHKAGGTSSALKEGEQVTERLVIVVEGARHGGDLKAVEEYAKEIHGDRPVLVVDHKEVVKHEAAQKAGNAEKAAAAEKAASSGEKGALQASEHSLVQGEKAAANPVKKLLQTAGESKLGQTIEKVATKAAPAVKVLGHLAGAVDAYATAESIIDDVQTLRHSDSMGEKAVAVLDLAGNALMMIPTPQTKAIGLGITLGVAAGKALYEFFKSPDPPPTPQVETLPVDTPVVPQGFPQC